VSYNFCRLRASERESVAMIAAVRVIPCLSAYSSSRARSGGGKRSDTITPRSSSGSFGLPPAMFARAAVAGAETAGAFRAIVAIVDRARWDFVARSRNGALAAHGALVGVVAPAMAVEAHTTGRALAFGPFGNRHGAGFGSFVHHGSYRNTQTRGCQGGRKAA